MKSRDANLDKHYDHTFDYWTHIVCRKIAMLGHQKGSG